jgi:rubredoxin
VRRLWDEAVVARDERSIETIALEIEGSHEALDKAWCCPACHVAIRHTEFEPLPRRGITYRCHICRLELALEPSRRRLDVTPVRQDW